MRVTLFPADHYGCGHYRMRLPATYVGEGITCDFRDRVDLKTSNDLRTSTVRLHAVNLDTDVAVFQRPMDSRLVPTIEMLQKQGVAVVVELDDDLGALDPTHISWASCDPRRSPHSNWRHAREACKLADLVTVSTPALASKYAPHGRVAVLENCVDEQLLRVRSEKGPDIGWSGITATHPHDLQEMGGAIASLVREGYTFDTVGNPEGVKRALGLSKGPSGTGWVPLDLYYVLVSRFRVGVVPLADTAFNVAKSVLKGIEYAALGVPFVASPTEEYLKLRETGAGTVADHPRRWTRYLKHLLINEQAHAELAASGREAVRENYVMQYQAWRWAEAWAKAVSIRHERGKVAA